MSLKNVTGKEESEKFSMDFNNGESVFVFYSPVAHSFGMNCACFGFIHSSCERITLTFKFFLYFFFEREKEACICGKRATFFE